MGLLDGLEMIKQGAEAKVYVGDYMGKPAIFKERFRKTYRHPTLDQNITKERMKAEARALLRCRTLGIPVPAVYNVDLVNRCIVLEQIESVTIGSYIDKVRKNCQTKPQHSLKKIMDRVGELLAKMHKNGVIHGDLTTSNMLLASNKDDNRPDDGEDFSIYFIDFGLCHIDQSAEDKGVDLYVLERAYLSSHPSSQELFQILLESYNKSYGKGIVEISNKLEEIRMRGRKRTMVG